MDELSDLDPSIMSPNASPINRRYKTSQNSKQESE
jgi:hypothetical protein